MTAGSLTIFLLCYNDARRLAETLDRLPVPDRGADRLVIIDDGSTDESFKIADAVARAGGGAIEVDRKKSNRGVNVRMNEALASVDTDYVMFAACGDSLYPDTQARLREQLDSNADAGLATAPSWIVASEVAHHSCLSPDLPPRKAPGALSPEECLEHFFGYGSWIMSNTTMFRVDALRACRGFDPALGPFADGYAVMSIACRHGCAFDPEPAGEWRREAESHSGAVRADPVLSLQVLARAMEKMAGEHPELYSEAFRKRFNLRWRFNLAHDLLRASPSDVKGAETAIGGNGGLLCWAGLAVSRWFGYGAIGKAMLYAGTRPFDVATRIRRQFAAKQ